MNHSWNIRKFGDICTSELGKTRDEKRNKGSFRPYLCAINVQWDRFELSDLKEMRFEDNEYDRYTVRKGDLVICEGGDIGRAAIWDKEEPIHYQNALHRVRFDNGVNARFILYYLYFLKQAGILDGRYGKGVTIKHLVKSSLLSIPVPVPPLNEQQRIVDELDLLTGIIDKKNAQLRDLDALAQSIFYEMFGDPSAAFYGRSDSALKIGDFSECIAGATPSTKINSYWSNGTIPWLSSGEVAKGRVFATDTMISQEGYDSCSTRLVPKNSVLIAMAGQGKTRGTVGISGIELCTNQSICSIIVNDKIILPDYLYYELKLLYNELRSISNGDGGRGGLNLKLIQGFSVIVPDIEEQMTFVKRAKAIETQKALIQDSLIQSKILLDSRMSYYFG